MLVAARDSAPDRARGGSDLAAHVPAAGPASGRILVIDDDPHIRAVVGRALAGAGFATDLAGTAAEGLRRAVEARYDVIILDLLMPDADGRHVLDRVLCVRPGQVVVVLSCLADVAAKVDCLRRGAQDYLTKPFSLAELLARVRLRLRNEEKEEDVIRAERLTLDAARLEADAGGGAVPLTRLEFLLLKELASRAGQPVSKGVLLAAVWGYDSGPGSNVVDVCVRRLRSKFGFDLIKTVRGAGYQLGKPAAPRGLSELG